MLGNAPWTVRRCAVAVLLLLPGAAQACRCIASSQAAAARSADAVVLADVEPGGSISNLSTAHRVRILDSWKRHLTGRLNVTTERTDCAAELIAGHRYLLYLRRTSRGYSTEACSGNLPAAQATGAIARLRRQYR